MEKARASAVAAEATKALATGTSLPQEELQQKLQQAEEATAAAEAQRDHAKQQLSR